jgi:ATP-binding cassette subfamily F protein 3
MREALTMALQDYEGALVVVSHDRHLLKSTTDNFYLVDDGIVDEFNGDLEDYQKYLLEKQKQLIEQNNLKNQEKTDLNKPKELSWKEKKQLEYNFKNEIRPLKQQITRLDLQIAELTKKKAELEITLADNSIYNDENKSKLAELFTEQNDVTSKLEETEMLWLDLSEQLEQRQQDFEKIISGGKPC